MVYILMFFNMSCVGLQETLLHGSLPTRPHLDSGPNSPINSTEAATLRPVSIRPAPKSQNSSASNSPPDSPPRNEDLAGADDILTLEWGGRSQPESTTSKTGIRVPPASSDRSPSNSPPTSPPKFSEQSSLMRWKRRSEPAANKTDYVLSQNVLCQSETSSPPYSPPPQSDSESPKQWDERSEVSSSSDPSESSDSTEGNKNGSVEVYRPPGSSLPPDLLTMSDDDDGSSGSSSRSEPDEEVDKEAAKHEHGMVETSASGSTLHNPSNSSSGQSSFEVPSSEPNEEPEDLNGSHQPSDAQFSPSAFGTAAEPVLLTILPQMDGSQKSIVGSEPNFIPSTDPPPPPPALESTDTPSAKGALAAAIAHHDWNMVR